MEEIRTEKMDTDKNHFVVMSNDLARGKSAMDINSAKLLRLLIMQSKYDDSGFFPYSIKIIDLAELLKIDPSNLYRNIQEKCIALLQSVVLIGDGNPKHKWKAFQWVTRCSYDPSDGCITIQLHDDLKPYILQLRKNYIQYELINILMMKSFYSIRIYELISIHSRNKAYANKIEKVYLSVEEIRKSTDTEKKYEKISDFRKNVIDVAVKELNAREFGFQVIYTTVKTGRKITGFEFTLYSIGNPDFWDERSAEDQ